MRHIKTFEGLFTKDNKPEVVPFEIDRILQELENQKPVVTNYKEDGHKEFNDHNKYDVYETSFYIDGENIEIKVTDPVYIPFVRPIVSINRFQYNTGKNKKILNILKDIKNQQN